MTCLISFLTVVVFCRTVDLTVRKGVAFWASVFIYSAVSEANACLSDVPGNLRCVGSFVSPVPSNKIGRTTPTNKSVLLSFFSSFLFLHYFTLDLSTSFVCVCVFFSDLVPGSLCFFSLGRLLFHLVRLCHVPLSCSGHPFSPGWLKFDTVNQVAKRRPRKKWTHQASCAD